MRRGRAHEDAAGRIDAVRAGERERQPGERWSAPADRRAARVGAERVLDGAGDDRREALGEGRELVRGAARPPVEDEVRRLRVSPRDGLFPARLVQRRGADEDRSFGIRRPWGACTKGTTSTVANPSSADGGSSSRRARICDVGARTPGSRLASRFSSSGEGSEPNRSSNRPTRFACAWSSGTSSQMHRVAMP